MMKRTYAVLFVLLLAVSLPIASRAETCCQGRVGDINGSGDEPTVTDVSFFVALLWIFDTYDPVNPPAGACMPEADINQSGGLSPTQQDLTISDIGILISYLFIDGAYDPVSNPSGIILPDCLVDPNDPHGQAVTYGECKSGVALSDPNTTCIDYSYDGVGTLSLTHVNAGLNCCPMPALSVAVHDHVITITESDDGLCDCLCLYDVEYEIENLPPGQYRIVVSEAVPFYGEPLDFTVDLTSAPSGQYCVVRGGYPWGGELMTGITERSGCLSGSSVAAQSATVPLDQSCVSYSYDPASQVLSITHHNAGFNCCPETITLTAKTDGSTIVLTESESFGSYGGCSCLCLFDYSGDISNLPPGEYNLVFNELYAHQGSPLSFTVDLTAAASGDVCVQRDYYPWGVYEASR